MPWSLYWLYPYALAATLALAGLSRSPRLMVNVAAIVFNWVILSNVGDQMTVLLNAAVDVTSAEIALIAMQSMWSRYVVLTWVAMLLTHACAGMGWLDGIAYWRALFVLSWLQLIVCFLWGGSHGGRRIRNRLARTWSVPRHPVFGALDRQGLDEADRAGRSRRSGGIGKFRP